MWKVFGIFREDYKTKIIILFENKKMIWYNRLRLANRC